MKTRLHSIPRACGIALAVALLTTPSAANADIALQSDESSPWTQDGNGVWTSPAVGEGETSTAWFETNTPCIVTFKWRTVAQHYGAALVFYRDGEDLWAGTLDSPRDEWAVKSFSVKDEHEAANIQLCIIRDYYYAYSGDDCIYQVKDINVQPIFTETIGQIKWSYVVDDGKATIIGAENINGSYRYGSWQSDPIEGAVTVPTVVGENVPVTAIGDNVLTYCDAITSLTIPEGITSIGNSSLSHCNALTDIAIPDTVTSIGASSVSSCNLLTNITIGAGLASYGEYSFNGNGALRSFTVSGSNATYSSEDGVLYNKAKTALLKCPAMKTSLTVPATVTEIAERACSGCALEEVNISEGLETIGASAFYECDSLPAIDLPASLETIGESAFLSCNLLADVDLGGVKDIGDSAFSSCGSLETIVIPNSTTNIGGCAFAYCGELYDVTIGSGVRTIGVFEDERGDEDSPTMVNVEPAFGGCGSLMDFKLAEGNEKYEEIGGCLFYRATPKYEKTLAVYPPGRDDLWFTGDVYVTKIGDGACAMCFNFTTLVITNSVREIGSCSFASDGDLSKLVVQDGVTNICYAAFQMNPELMDVEIAGSVKRIGKDVFIHDYMPSDIWENRRFGRLVLHEGIETIAGGAFNFCQWLGEIVIPDSVTTLGKDAFSENWYGAPTITIGNGVETLPEGAFADCPCCTRITFGENVTTIEDYAFSGCNNVTGLEIPGGVTSIGQEAFSNCYELRTLSLPDSLVSVGTNAFSGCRRLNKLVVPANVTELGDGAFAEAYALWKIYLPATLKPEETEGGETVDFLSRIFPDTIDGGTSEEYLDELVFWYSNENPLPYATVTFNDGEAQTNEQVLAFFDKLPVVSKSGHAFAGWWTTPDDEEDVGSRLFAQDEVEDGAEYFARWEETPFTFSGDAPWFVAGYDSDYDATILQSSPLGYGEVAVATTNVTGTGYFAIKFENNGNEGDYLRIYVDGVRQASFSASTSIDFINVSILEGGDHVVEIRYENFSGNPESYGQFSYVDWRPANVCTITFNANGGSAGEATRRVIANTSAGKLPEAKKSGKVFAGWYTDASGGERVISTTPVTASITLYARYTDAPFTTGGEAGWLIDEDDSLRTEGIAIGQSATMETTFSGRKRVSFKWKTDLYYSDYFKFYVDGEAEIYRSGQVSKWQEFTRDFEDDGETHTIKWEFARSEYSYDYDDYDNCGWLGNIVVADIYTATFDDNYEGGTTDERVVAGVLGELPEAPDRDDYFAFAGWWTQRDGGTLVTSETPVNSDVTYYAHWAPTPYKFQGEWAEDGDGSWRSMVTKSWTTYSATKEVEGPCVVRFKWKAVTASGDQTVNIIDRTDGGYEYLVNTNYPEVGEDDGWNDFELTISDGLVHEIKFSLYTGYFSSSSFYIAIKDFVVTPIASYTLTFNPNYGNEEVITRKVPQENAVVGETPALWRNGYAVNGWWTAATGGDRIATNTVVSADTAYYAHWVESPFEFSGVRPWVMGPDGEWRTSPMTVYGNYYATATVQGPCVVTFEWKSSVGYSGRYMNLEVDGNHNGWCESGDWEQKTIKIPGEGEHTVLLRAYVNNASSATAGENCFMVRNYNVSELVPCVVTFNANYDGGTNTNRNYVAGDALGELPVVVRDGYMFIGWFTAATGGDQVSAGTTVISTMTVYAQWQKVVTVPVATFESTGGNANWTDTDGVWCSGTIGHSQSTWAQISVTGPCEVSFSWKASSESVSYDYLYIAVDGTPSGSEYKIGGETDWVKKTISIGDGSHNVRWTYVKDSSVSQGSDCGWVKDVVIVKPATPDPGSAETPVVDIDTEKMEAPAEDGNGNIVIEAKDGETLTQTDVDNLEIKSPTEPAVDITAAYVKTLDVDANAIVMRLADPVVDPEGGASYEPETEDSTGLLDDAEAVETAGALAAKPETTGDEEVGALPVKMYPGLWYQAEWGSSLDSMTPGVKFRATSGQTHIGVIKQKDASGFYKISVSDK